MAIEDILRIFNTTYETWFTIVRSHIHPSHITPEVTEYKLQITDSRTHELIFTTQTCGIMSQELADRELDREVMLFLFNYGRVTTGTNIPQIQSFPNSIIPYSYSTIS